MKWKLVWTQPARRDMKKLDSRVAKRVRGDLQRLSETGRGDVKKLRDRDPPEWRLRSGNFRAFFRYETKPREIHVLRVRRRDQAY